MVFNESQKINNLGIKVMFASTLVPIYFILYKEVNERGGFTQGDVMEWSVLFLFLVLVYLLVFESKATLRIDFSGIHYQYKPIIWKEKTIVWNDIESLEVKAVSPLSDFGGWGLKFGFGKKGMGIILSGDHALVVTKKSGRKFTITTSRKAEISRVGEYWMKENNHG
jgi:hypothetical protein